MKIETVTRDNFEDVLPLIAGYQTFYKAEPDEERNRRYFDRYLDSHEHGVLFLARDDDGTPQGFATLYFTPSSVQAAITATFNDLFTIQGTRGKGIGLGLAIHVMQHARELGYKSVGWNTQKDNKNAQRLYDFSQAEKSEWISYSLSLG